MKCFVFVLLIAVIAMVSNAEVARDERCNLPIQAGRCFAYFPRFAYNSEKNECVEFIYGGCDGNDNQFVFKEACEKACIPK